MGLLYVPTTNAVVVVLSVRVEASVPTKSSNLVVQYVVG